MAGHPTIQYKAIQQPVLTAAQTPEQVTESRWHQPFSDPVRRRGIAVALIASGCVLPEWGSLFPEFIPESDWHQAWSEPVRVKPALRAGSQAFFGNFPQDLAETITESRWHQPWSEPVRLKTKLIVAAHQVTAQTLLTLVPEDTTVSKWFANLSEPVRVKPRLNTGAQQALQFIGAAPFPETVTFSRWNYPWSEPVRIKRLLPVQDQDLFEIGPLPIIQITWYMNFSEPVRIKPGLDAADQQFIAYPSAAFTLPVLTRRNLYTQATPSMWVVRYPS